jgi:hypothetical protein
MVMPYVTNRNRHRTTVIFFLIISWGAVGPLWLSLFYFVEFEAKSTGPATSNHQRAPEPYLARLLIDAGTHYTRIKWLKRVVDHLADTNYNLIHFRLTDDQTFNVLLDSHPELAFPTSVDNPDLTIFPVSELRELTSIPLNVTHPALRPILLHSTKNHKSFHKRFGIISSPLSLFFPLPSSFKSSQTSAPLSSPQNPARLTFRISHEWFASQVIVVSVGLK